MSAVLTTIKNFLGQFSGDVLLLISLTIIIFGAVFYFGKARAVTFVISFHLASILYLTFPFLDRLFFLDEPRMLALNKIGIFLVFFIILYFITSKFISTALVYDAGTGIVKKLLITAGILVCVLIFVYQMADITDLYDFSPHIDQLFDSEAKLFYWKAATLLLLAII